MCLYQLFAILKKKLADLCIERAVCCLSESSWIVATEIERANIPAHIPMSDQHR
jgi:hypothetical protein